VIIGNKSVEPFDAPIIESHVATTQVCSYLC